jgi:hypothetical protein
MYCHTTNRFDVPAISMRCGSRINQNEWQCRHCVCDLFGRGRFGTHLGSDVICVGNIQQAGDFVHQVVFIRADVLVSVGHLPHGFEDAYLFRHLEFVVEEGGELLEIVGRFGCCLPPLYQLRHLYLRQVESFLENLKDRVALFNRTAIRGITSISSTAIANCRAFSGRWLARSGVMRKVVRNLFSLLSMVILSTNRF